MRSLTLGRRAAPAGLALLVLVAGCEKPKPRGPAAGQSPPTTAPAPPKPAVTAEALPTQPAWAQALIGKPFKQAFPNDAGAGVCLGNTDLVNLRYQGASPGVRVEGWGWDQAAKAPIARIVLVDVSGRIVGAGETGLPRPDVTAARKDITSPTTGWQAVTAATSGGLDAFGILAGDGKTACRMGHINL